MLRRLFLMRHAEASWGGPDVGDLQRPLTEKGRRQAQAQGLILRELGVERIICSPAARAVETAEGTGLKLDVSSEGTLYNSSAQRIRTQLAKIPEYVNSVLVVAHSPGVAELARYLADQRSDAAALALIRYTYPPATLTALEFDSLWPDLHAARLFLAKIP
ncbi:MAG: histidine phosphatase family protein [Propionibacteriaceae bacterium]|nr:histidine phosphatase family protein [Propionibacteriaceae bacterium]